MNVCWENIREGDRIPELIKKPGVTQLVKYSAGSGDFNPLHHDYHFEQARKIGSIIVHGRYKYAMMGEAVSNWLAHSGRIRKISCQYRGMDFPDREITCKGSVERKFEENGEKLIELSLYIENSKGDITTPGTAIVVFD